MIKTNRELVNELLKFPFDEGVQFMVIDHICEEAENIKYTTMKVVPNGKGAAKIVLEIGPVEK